MRSFFATSFAAEGVVSVDVVLSMSTGEFYEPLMYFLNITGTSHKHLTTCSLFRFTMIYNVSGRSQNRLMARVSTERRQRRQFTLAQRRHLVTLVDRAMQDVGINKPFKANMRKIYTEWLLEQDADAAIPSASRLNVSAWILESVKGIKKETIVNSWRKTGFSYFE